jgi:hypothetical protein
VPRQARHLRKVGLVLAAAVIGAGLAPMPASADGPGYGGDADALSILWGSDARTSDVAVYAGGFRGGSAVRVQVGADGKSVTADPYGTVDLLLSAVVTSDAAVTGATVLVTGHGPTGQARTLVGAVPPKATGSGMIELLPWAAALAGSGMSALWLYRRNAVGVARQIGRYRYVARRRA